MVKNKTLEDCFTYRMYNHNNKIANNIVKMLKEGTIIKKENLEEFFIVVNKNYKFPLKYRVLEEFKNGDIILVFPPGNLKLPTSMPFFLTMNQGRPCAVVNMGLYGTMNPETKDVTIDFKKLYTIMESAYMAKDYTINPDRYRNNNVVLQECNTFANIFIRPLNKKYSLNISPNKMQLILYLTSVFYLKNILGVKNAESIKGDAMKGIRNVNPQYIEGYEDYLFEEDFKDISTFIEALKKRELNLGMDDLTVRGYMEQYINMYDASALFALESFQYYIHMVNAVNKSAYLNNQYILEDLVNTKLLARFI